MWSHHSRVDGEENISQTTNHTPSDTPQDAIGPPGQKRTVLVHGHPAAHHDPKVPFPYFDLQQGSPQLILVSGAVLAQKLDSTLALIIFY